MQVEGLLFLHERGDSVLCDMLLFEGRFELNSVINALLWDSVTLD